MSVQKVQGSTTPYSHAANAQEEKELWSSEGLRPSL